VDEAIRLERRAGGRDKGASRKRARLALGTVAVIAAAAAAGITYRFPKQARVEGSLGGASIFPEMREIDSTVTTSGTVRLRTGAEVRVGSQVSGIVQKLNVTVGSRIQRTDAYAGGDGRGERGESAEGSDPVRALRS